MPAQRKPGPVARRRALLVAASGLAILSGATALALILRFKGLDAAAAVAQLLSVPLALLPCVRPALDWWRDRRGPAVFTPEDLARAKEHLAMLVAEQWRTESRIRALDDPDPIPVRWRLTERDDLLDSTANRTAGVLTIAFSDDVAALVAQYRRLRRPRLVILGDAGAGKTTLAVQIVLELLSTRPERSPDPVPVLVSFAGWGRRPDVGIDDWVADRIMHDYPELAAAGFGPHVIDGLVAHRHVLPVLDGLDEIELPAQVAAIGALNDSMDGDAQLILTSRTEEFGSAVASAGRALASAVVIEPDALTPRAAADYLQRCLPARPPAAWGLILRRLRGGATRRGPVAGLAGIATTPLGLWLIRAAYIAPGADPSPLLDDRRLHDAPSLQAHLFDQLVQACVAARTPSDDPKDLFRPRNKYDPRDVERWLRFLAANLDRWGSRDFDWIQDVHRLTGPAPRAAAFGRVVGGWVDAVRDRLGRMTTGGRRTALLLPPAVALLLICGAAIGTKRAVLGALPPLDGKLENVLATVVAGALVFAVLALPGWVLLVVLVAEDGADWPATATEEWHELREQLVKMSAAGSALGIRGLVAGVVCGVFTAVLAGETVGWWVGVVVAGAVIAATLTRDAAERAAAAGSSPPIQWTLNPLPWMQVGLLLSATAGTALGLMLGTSQTSGIASLLPHLLWSVGLCAALLVVAVTPWCGALPLVHAVADALSRAVFAATTRRIPASSGPDDWLSSWRRDRIEHLRGLLRLAFAALLLCAATGAVWFTAQQNPTWRALTVGGVEPFLARALSQLRLTWDGQLRYPVAIMAAVLITAKLYRAARPWRRWLLRIGIAGAVVLLWPDVARPDDFRLALSGQFEELRGTVTGEVGGRLAEFGGLTLVSRHEIDTAALFSDGQPWLSVPLLVTLLPAALVAIFALGEQPAGSGRWWAVTVATARHAANGRLPGDLAAFLDDAHRLGLLRAVGAVYQFRHAELQDHFARAAPAAGQARDAEPEPTSAGAPHGG
jgi:hypothetical protein